MAEQLLSGKRVLIVEDEMLVLMSIEDMLAELGCTSMVSAANVEQALDAIEAHSFDLATIDVNLNGSRSYAVADSLAEHDVPFVFSTGYGDHEAGHKYRHRPVLAKPYNCSQMSTVLAALLALQAGGPAAVTTI